MENIFFKEEQVINEAERLLELNKIDTESDELVYKDLLEEYKKLLKQMMMLIKISDLNQSELNTLSKRFEINSTIDYLTGLYNRRYFNEIFQKEWFSALRSNSFLAVVMIDIDLFKNYNDIYGHLQGDTCLKLVAEAIKKAAVRPRDVAARFGGEEFVLLLPETDIEGGKYIAGRIIDNIDKLNLEHIGSHVSKKVTVSLGVSAAIPQKKDSPNNFLNTSDVALYRAKAEGRNCYRVCC